MHRRTLPPNLGRKALYGLFATWFGLTVVGQKLYRDPRRRSAWDKLCLVIPDWRFFAPNPGVHDQHLLMRDQLTDGTLTPWQEISHVEERTLLHALWHPHRRAEKTVFDASAELLRNIDDEEHQHRLDGKPDPTLQLSIPYLTLLAHVTSRQHHPDAERTQFLIAMSGGYDEQDEPAMVFLSELHALGRTRSVANVGA
ncbi:DUF5819 family protein [Prauserella rugosa]|uniref:Uncharacterized protein n=1 Tax=Prauserella rugosa TaxID=43354 RepID=A0A660CAX6_9PSEU|nr:DUF5819 family protein [Prauserella rugosa]KMS87533.1 hypothetical protein ACZ91_30845 [Streptomyces regensis]TWH20708.1 hypothetical protein JD82_02555 [Prauserella rugosa]